MSRGSQKTSKRRSGFKRGRKKFRDLFPPLLWFGRRLDGERGGLVGADLLALDCFARSVTGLGPSAMPSPARNGLPLASCAILTACAKPS